MASLYKHKIKHTSKVFINSFIIKYIRKSIHQNFPPLKIHTTASYTVNSHFVYVTIHKQRMIVQFIVHIFKGIINTPQKSAFHTQCKTTLSQYSYICYARGLKLLQCRSLCNHSFYNVYCADTIRKLKKQLILKLYVTPSHLKSRVSVVLQI